MEYSADKVVYFKTLEQYRADRKSTEERIKAEEQETAGKERPDMLALNEKSKALQDQLKKASERAAALKERTETLQKAVSDGLFTALWSGIPVLKHISHETA